MRFKAFISGVLVAAVIFVFASLVSFANQGKRFTFCDGVILYVLVEKETSIPPECGELDTEFINYIKEL